MAQIPPFVLFLWYILVKADSVCNYFFYTFLVGGRWQKLAHRLGFSHNEISFLDERTTNPSDVLLNIVAKHYPFRVGELYDMLVESELPLAADML